MADSKIKVNKTYLPKDIGEFNESNIVLGDNIDLKNGGKFIKIKFNGSDLNIQTPKSSFPFGINRADFQDKTKLTAKPRLNFSLEKNNEKHDSLKNTVIRLQDYIKSLLEKPEIAQKFFGKKKGLAKSVIDKNFTSSVKINDNEKYNDTLGAAIHYNKSKDEIYTNFYDGDNNNKQLFNKKSLSGHGMLRGTVCKCIITPEHIWVSGKGFGISFVYESIILYQNESSSTNNNTRTIYDFKDETDDEFDNDEEVSSEKSKDTNVSADDDSDSDDDSDDSDDDSD
jgi:hypothetical protein